LKIKLLGQHTMLR